MDAYDDAYGALVVELQPLHCQNLIFGGNSKHLTAKDSFVWLPFQRQPSLGLESLSPLPKCSSVARLSARHGPRLSFFGLSTRGAFWSRRRGAAFSEAKRGRLLQMFAQICSLQISGI